MRIFLPFGFAVLMGAFTVIVGQTPPPLAARPVRVVGKAEVFYFKNSDTSRVKVDTVLLGTYAAMLREDYFTLSASFSTPGAKLTRPKAVMLTLYSYSHGTDYRYRNDNQVAIFLDNKPLVSGRAREWFLNIDPRGGVTEYYVISMSYDDFLKMIKSKDIALKFGKTRFGLKHEQVDALADLNRAIE
jgi:hypothetical protein